MPVSELLKEEALRLLSYLTAAALLGWLVGHPGWAVALAFLAYIVPHLRQLDRLHHWLSTQPADVPEATGVWGEIFQRIYQLRRDENRAQDNLRGIIGRARASVAALREAVVLIDGEGDLEWWNPAAEELLGLQTPTDFGQPVTNLIREPAFARFCEQGSSEEPLLLPSALHPGRQLQFSITRFGVNDRLLVVTDVTRLQNLEQMRKDFVANISHELRTPLTVLTGYLETMQAHEKDIEPRWRRALEQMEAQAARMNNLVNDLLLLSRLESESTRQPFRPIDVPALLAQLQADATTYGRGRHQKITLDCDTSLKLMGREDDLKSAFANLVTNAVKYTQPYGDIRLRWWADGKKVYFSVSDNGIGIEARHIPRLTERFYRTDVARSSATGGTGLGLAIVKHVLLEHEARLDIHSVLGKGSTFTCVFPGSLAVR
ncbi:MAG: sensor histidine kinase [Moraxellaceae bacterium]|nr:sensor histidine kinase [Moraxellaceae bacterium]